MLVQIEKMSHGGENVAMKDANELFDYFGAVPGGLLQHNDPAYKSYDPSPIPAFDSIDTMGTPLPRSPPITSASGANAPAMYVDPNQPAQGLLKAVAIFRKVEAILLKCSQFWANMDLAIADMTRSREHIATIVKYTGNNQRIRERFLERMKECEGFWKQLQLVGETYCQSYAETYQKQQDFVMKMKMATDQLNPKHENCPVQSSISISTAASSSSSSKRDSFHLKVKNWID